MNKGKIVKAGAGLILLLMLTSSASASTQNNGGGSGNYQIIPQGGVAPGAPEGSMQESFLGTDNVPGISNNNPGNIKWTLARLADPWEGSIDWDYNTDRVFEQFATLADGTRAMIKLLRNYIVEKGRNTPKIIIQWWDLGNPSYLSFLLTRTGFTQNQILTADKQTLKKLVQAMSRFEVGEDFITDQRFENGWQLFSN